MNQHKINSILISDENAGTGEIVKEIIRRVVSAAAPEKIILFGSTVKGMHTPESDIDILVIKKCEKRRELAEKIYRAMIGVGKPVDIIVATPEDIERYRDSRALVIYSALTEGKIVYAA